MSTPLPPLLSRSLAVVLLAAIVAGGFLLVALPLAGRFETVRREIDEKRSTLGRLGAIKAAELRISGAAEGDPLQLFLAGDSESTMLAGLQSRVAEIANLEGVEIRSARALEAIDRDPVRFIGVEVQMTARLEQVQGILIALESGEPISTSSGPTLRPRQRQVPRERPGAATST
jgi:hypothetical protein